MKKIVVVMMLMAVMSVTGCSQKAYEDYIKASEKTQAYKSGKTSIHVSSKVTFGEDQLSIDEIAEMSEYNDLRFDMTLQYNMDEKKIAADMYTNIGGAGMDYHYYQEGEKRYVRLPIIKKFLIVEDNAKQTSNPFAGISSRWLNMLEEEDVVQGENTIIDSAEGQVKAKVVTISLTENQLKIFGNEVITLLMSDGFIENYLESNMDREELVSMMKSGIEHTDIKDFQLTIYIDFDGYVIKETLSMCLDMEEISNGKMETMDIIVEKQNWEIGKEQDIVLPEMKEEDVIEMEGLESMDDIPWSLKIGGKTWEFYKYEK
ncbi:hypothetical protein HZI73_24110 [Vallitalea pronyensis]|uniref:Uncharacterized protein n=1 Tax=Vallitalea pronyensis TaxID=1348613 RepID=A0A8J8MNQ9_9FIRM|nr:hypothetical protein [Vallitalea pronyensis]QUI25190.1 hypothetical protein HZI73_24110 [Vallitalea pronyensis]